MATILPPSDEEWYVGDTIQMDFDITEDGDPLDITGAELVFTAKLKMSDADNAFTTIQKTIGSGIDVLDAVNGEILITLDPADTSALRDDTMLVFDIQITIDGAVYTTIIGTLSLLGDVTQI